MLRYNSELYERIRVLGKGSFGTAVVHRRRTDCALVVLKEIDLSRFADERRRLAALQEAHIMSELSHENIINYFGAYTTDTKLIIEMEYARIGTLHGYLAEQRQLLAEEEALSIFRQVVAGLDYLHAKQIVHLDLKMGNIFISAEGTIKLGDFGIAQFMAPASSRPAGRKGAHSACGQLGTLAYSSPERCLGLATDYQSDIWSLGCILYELLTLRLLFAADSLAELVTSITQVKYRPIELVNEHVSPLTLQMFARMIAKEPGERASASELVQLVQQSLARLEAQRLRQAPLSGRRARRRDARAEPLSTEAANLAALDPRRNILSQIQYPHSFVYQVRLDRQNVRLDRVNLPQTKRIKQIVKGASHYLALTYDNIVYGWGSRNCGQLGSSKLSLACGQTGERAREARARKSRSARNSFTARDSLRADHWRRLNQMVSLTQPPSLASSTQTLELPAEGVARATLDHETILRGSAPTSKPFIINELNKRKIERVGAGNNFSVFLSKTGIVMTCGDGSAGCLGRGDLRSSLTPRMVESLLSMDVVGVASGPEHVVAVCVNGQAFVWGNAGAGRLGLGGERALNERLMYATGNALQGGKYVTLPQQLSLPTCGPRLGGAGSRSAAQISIVAAFCGDKSTVFIDSNHSCWACGENRHNKLGLDIRRKFKRTIVVEYAWTPRRVVALSKYRIVSCTIGPNHSTFLTTEGRVLVLGQDIDHAYRLECNMMNTRHTQRRILAQLGQPGRPPQSRGAANCFRRKPKRRATTPAGTAVDGRLLVRSLLAHNQLLEFKSEQPDGWRNLSMGKECAKIKATRFQRQQIETYLKRSRGLKRMPFEGALAVSCTSKLTLVLTSDNRVYFWGTRSYRRQNCCPAAAKASELEWREEGAPLQLVCGERDECFVKISSTNSTLMDNIESLGSDQPILQARDPRLVANSLADLWILDYRASTSAPSSASSASEHSLPPISGPSSANASTGSLYGGGPPEEGRPPHECHKHDAILEPQPIVSLYVPSMFNYNGCALRLVNLFCYDADRFFLVLDTTITMQQQQQQAQPPSPTLAAHWRPSNSRRASRQSSRLRVERSQMCAHTKRWAEQPNAGCHDAQQASMRLNMVEESQSRRDSDERSHSWRARRRASCNASVPSSGHNIGQCLHEYEARVSTGQSELAKGQPSDRIRPECCRCADTDRELSARRGSSELVEANMTTATNSNSGLAPAIQMSPISQNGFSLEEPRSMSTFLANLDPQHGNIIMGPSLKSFAGPLRRLDFEQPPGEAGGGPLEALEAAARHQRRHRSMVNVSESNGPTCDDFDETTSMPTWVRDEFLQQQAPSSGAFRQAREREQLQPGAASTPSHSPSRSGSNLTGGSSGTHFRSALSISSRTRPTDGELSRSSSAEYQSTLVNSQAVRQELGENARPATPETHSRRLSAPGAPALARDWASEGMQATRSRPGHLHSLSLSQPDLSACRTGERRLSDRPPASQHQQSEGNRSLRFGSAAEGATCRDATHRTISMEELAAERRCSNAHRLVQLKHGQQRATAEQFAPTASSDISSEQHCKQAAHHGRAIQLELRGDARHKC